MKIIYAFSYRLLSQYAPPLQVAQNCTALARKAEVHLLARAGYDLMFSGDGAIDAARLVQLDPRDAVAELYGVTVPKSLHLHVLPEFDWRWGKTRLRMNHIYHALCLARILGLDRRGSKTDVILVREMKMARYLLRYRKLLHLPPIVYESHEIFVATHRDEVERLGANGDRKEQWLLDTEGYICANADGIICTTQHMADMLQSMYPVRGKVLVAPNGIDLSPQAKIAGTHPNGGRTIMYLGSLSHWKGVDILIEAMKYLPDSVLRIVGGNDNTIRQHKQIVSELGVGTRVQFDGYVAPEGRFRRLHEADVLVLPLRPCNISTYFTSPLKIFEYMSVGKPIVTSDLPSTRELLTHDVNAVLVTPGDAKALAEGIRGVLDNTECAQRLAAQAQSDVRSRTWDHRADQVLDFFKSLAER
jgi:glycosyltransferase involved in cell wall biosynthesis